uniref:Uncharacterized protein n=1 Tax=Anguilla anguilla TaxID=7936 RepID=A0A0E9X2S9_ANGAN
MFSSLPVSVTQSTWPVLENNGAYNGGFLLLRPPSRPLPASRNAAGQCSASRARMNALSVSTVQALVSTENSSRLPVDLEVVCRQEEKKRL